VKIVRAKDRNIKPYSGDKIQRAELWRDGHDVAFDIFYLNKGAEYGEHTHDSWETMYVLEGKINLSGQLLEAGDFVFTEPGESHVAENLEDSIVLLGFGKHYD